MGVLKELIGRPGAASPSISVAAGCAALAMAVAHIVQTLWFVWPSGQFKNIHVNFATLLIFLLALEAAPRERRWLRRGLAALAMLACVPLLYIHIEHAALIEDRAFGPSDLDQAVAILMLALVLAATIREWGWVIPVMAAAGLLYGYFGYLFPGELLFHSGLSLNRLISYSSIPTFRGLFGFLTEESARTIFMFMLFAGVLNATGGADLIMKLSFAAVGRMRAGPAQAAVVSSGLFGMVSGSTVANVASQGAFTIPMMRRVGFSADFAGAIEAVSSTGGQITPPVLGLAAFLIVGITGIPYYEIMIATIFPALIFYLYLMVAIHVEALKKGIAPLSDLGAVTGTALDQMSNRQACLEYGHLMIGVVALFYFLSTDTPTGLAALYPVFIMLGTDAIKRLYQGRHAPSAALKGIVGVVCRTLAEGARGGAQVAVVVAVMNILVEMFVVTGFGQKLSYIMLAVSGENLWALLIMSAITCVILGCGVPTSAAYILVALLGAPALVKLGVPVLAAHLYVFFYANMASITPPVAIAALVAANISGGSYFRTAFICTWLGLPGFLLPLIFVIHPEILGLVGGVADQLLYAVLALMAVVSLTLCMQGYMLGPMSWLERLLLLPAAFGLLEPHWWTTVAGLVLLAAVVVHQFWRWRAGVPVVAGPAPLDSTADIQLGAIGKAVVAKVEQRRSLD